jgi:hypothetical protein
MEGGSLPLSLPLSGLYWQLSAGGCIFLLLRKLGDNLINPFIHSQILDPKVVGWRGLEPRTNALKGHCSTN